MLLTYIIIAVLLLAAELLYFRIADHFNIIDRPNERSSHSTIVLRGGGVVFALSMIVWAVMMVVRGHDVVPYLPFLCGLVMICGLCLLPTGRGAFGAGRGGAWAHFPKGRFPFRAAARVSVFPRRGDARGGEAGRFLLAG